jgi:hypothetical protein
MSESIAIPRHHHRPAARTRGRIHSLLLGGLLAIIFAALSLAIVASTVEVARSMLAEQAPVAESDVAFPVRELPPEWQWQPQGAAVEHMYQPYAPDRLERQRRGAGVDWIRPERRR